MTAPATPPHEAPAMRLPRFRFTLRTLMFIVALAAIWSFILAQAILYRRRWVGGQGIWHESD